MSWYQIIFASLVLTVLLLQQALAGPAHTLALTMASRTAKIPRTIRAPFRNTEIMTARGFGKRSENLRLIEVPPSFNLSEDNLEPVAFAAEDEEEKHRRQFPVNFIVRELLMNPALLRQFIRRFVDFNNDGIITQEELMAGSSLD